MDALQQIVEQCIYVVMYIKSWPAAEIRLHLLRVHDFLLSICLPLIQMKRVSHHACTNQLMHIRSDMEQQTNINM
jgi:hypothetical protein